MNTLPIYSFIYIFVIKTGNSVEFMCTLYRKQIIWRRNRVLEKAIGNQCGSALISFGPCSLPGTFLAETSSCAAVADI